MVQLVRGLLLQSMVRGSKPSGVGLLLKSVAGGWYPTCPTIDHLGVDTKNATINHLTLTGEDTWDWASLPQLVSHQ